MKAQNPKDEWHQMSFGVKVTGRKKEYRIYREDNLKYVCVCNIYSSWEQQDIRDHIASLSKKHNHHKLDNRKKPHWQRDK